MEKAVSRVQLSGWIFLSTSNLNLVEGADEEVSPIRSTMLFSSVSGLTWIFALAAKSLGQQPGPGSKTAKPWAPPAGRSQLNDCPRSAPRVKSSRPRGARTPLQRTSPRGLKLF